MADFKGHMMGAAVVSGVLATGMTMTGIATDKAVMGYFFLGVIGGLLPDIDSDTSIPIRIAFNVLTVVAGFLLVFHYAQRYSLVELTLLWVACFMLIRYGIFSLFTYITVHRGLFHSIPAGAVFGLITTLLAYRFFDSTALHAWICGLFIFLGFLVHLLLDEIYSVDLAGMQIKRSFGTAFNLGSLDDPLGTAALYLVLISLFLISPPTDSFIKVFSNAAIYQELIQRLVPHEGWFSGLFRGGV